MATSPMRTITIPEVELTLDQLVTAIRQLEPAAWRRSTPKRNGRPWNRRYKYVE